VQAREQCDDGEDNSTTGACRPGCIAATCGDGLILDGVEPCDGDELDGASCESFGFAGGGLLCGRDCTAFDTSGCYTCGNDEIDLDEVCDGTDLGLKTCSNQGFGTGTLACTPDCQLDVSGCEYCGNGELEAGEACDGSDLGGKTCANQGYGTRGTLGCAPDCGLDWSGCTP
jgi:hypothetical protein